MFWTNRSVVLKPYSKVAEQKQRSSCITNVKRKTKGISLSKDISTKCNRSVQFIKLTQRGSIKNVQRREIKLVVRMKGQQFQDKQETSRSNMFRIEKNERDHQNLSFNMNVDAPKQQFTKCNKSAVTKMGNEIKRLKQTKNQTINAFINLHLNNTKIPIARIL